jgi:hypothetical protein
MQKPWRGRHDASSLAERTIWKLFEECSSETKTDSSQRTRAKSMESLAFPPFRHKMIKTSFYDSIGKRIPLSQFRHFLVTISNLNLGAEIRLPKNWQLNQTPTSKEF